MNTQLEVKVYYTTALLLLVEFQCVAQGHKADFQHDYFMGILQRGFFPRIVSDIQSGS